MQFPIIEKLGGREAVRQALEKRGIPKSRDAIRMWHARGRIAGAMTLVLQQIASEQNVDYRLPDDFQPETNGKAA